MLQETGLRSDLRRIAWYNMEPVYVYRDLAYLLGLHLQALFRNMQFSPQMVLYYKKGMSKLQVAVEWLFGNIGNYFEFIDFKNLLQVNMSAVGSFTLFVPLYAKCTHLSVWQYCFRQVWYSTSFSAVILLR